MTSFYPRLLLAGKGGGRRRLATVLAAAVLGGCGASRSGDVNQAVGEAARAAQAVTQLSEQAMGSLCPAAVVAGHQLNQAQARDCLRRAWNGWLGELNRNGYDPNNVGEGK